MITVDKAIKAVKEKIELISKIRDYREFDTWQNMTSVTLTNIYPEKKDVVEKFHSIVSKQFEYKGNGDRTPTAKREAQEYLENIIKDLENFGVPVSIKPSEDKSVKLHVNQSSNQTQTTSVSVGIELIFDVIKGELRNSEIEQLKEILDSKEDVKTKKKNFIEKIKSFGSDVSSNILANLLTNPQVYEQLNQML
jgi:hypothetical protein